MAKSTALVATVCACKNKHPLADPTAGGLLCGAQTKQAGAKYPTCHRPAGWGTPDGVASGHRCKLHGGVTTTLKSGRYSTMKSGRVRDLIAEHENDPDPLNILPELAAARAVFIDYIERYEVCTAALLAWHESYQKPGEVHKPRQVIDLSSAMGHIDTITKIVERIEKIRAENAISRKDLIRVMDAMGRGLMKHIEDPAILKAIRAEWLAIAV